MVYQATDSTRAKKSGTRNRILKEARLLVSQGGFGAASIAEVARCSGIATGTIYRHFPSKAELVAEIFRHATEHELHEVMRSAQIEATASERMRRAVRTFAERALQGPRLAYALIAEPVDPLVERERLSYRFAYAEHFEDLIQEGIEAGEFAPQNVAITAAALVGMLSEALVGPLAPYANRQDETVMERQAMTDKQRDELLQEIIALSLRALGGKT
ncbi:MAG: TetR/AcrR family transcriptional regulator [Oceanospirillaceae bacterium]|nr:TetR/AcrR family transcriptional regulator [Oceanospirillaceae bacterium]MCP5350951.1 TetR/AcrR family transcriptional regulator [Oceanospirillaceae bacterium]